MRRTQTGTGTESETGVGTRMENKGVEEESFGIHHIRKEAEHKTRHCHSARGVISLDRRWRLQVARSFWSKIRRLLDGGVPRGEQGTRDRKGETVKGTGTTGMWTKTRTRIGMSTREGMGARTRARTETMTEMRVERRESPGTFKVSGY